MPHQRRVALLEAEVEKHRHMFCKARREHERCKVRFVVRRPPPREKIFPCCLFSFFAIFAKVTE